MNSKNTNNDRLLHIEILNHLISGFCLDDITLEHCSTIGYNERFVFSSVEKIYDLMKYRDYLLVNDHLYNSHHPLMNGNDRIPRVLTNRENIYYAGSYYTFSNLLDLLHKECPQSNIHHIRSSISLIDIRLDDHVNAILKINDKLDTIQRFQAQSTDKLIVFADMIDDIQKILEKS